MSEAGSLTTVDQRVQRGRGAAVVMAGNVHRGQGFVGVIHLIRVIAITIL